MLNSMYSIAIIYVAFVTLYQNTSSVQESKLSNFDDFNHG